jgi:hypothetical protein
MTKPRVALDYLTPAEHDRFRNGEWIASHGPRCLLCGCLTENHDVLGCLVCSCSEVQDT